MARLDRLLARNLACSRKEALRILRRGALRDGQGRLLTDPREEIRDAVVEFDGRRVHLRERVHLMQHKPAGVVTSRKDGIHETAWARLRGAPLHAELLAIGRLDLDATGLLLWTTEGAAVHALTHPKRAVVRQYQVALGRPFAQPSRDDTGTIQLELADGYRPSIVEIAELEQGEQHPALPLPPATERLARIELRSGAFHEVKRIFAALGSEVLVLTRTSHAGLRLPDDLLVGEWRELDELPIGVGATQ